MVSLTMWIDLTWPKLNSVRLSLSVAEGTASEFQLSMILAL
jgi:hypothetical protein